MHLQCSSLISKLKSLWICFVLEVSQLRFMKLYKLNDRCRAVTWAFRQKKQNLKEAKVVLVGDIVVSGTKEMKKYD